MVTLINSMFAINGITPNVHRIPDILSSNLVPTIIGPFQAEEQICIGQPLQS